MLERIVLACSQEKDIVLDPFCGSGTTGVVALKNSRNFVGIDAEVDYLNKMAIPRMMDVFNQNKLFTFNKTDESAVKEKQAEYTLLP